MVTDGNGNSSGIVGKWVVDPFCDCNGNGKKKCEIHNICILPLLFPSVTFEHLYLFAFNPFIKGKTIKFPSPLKNYFL